MESRYSSSRHISNERHYAETSNKSNLPQKRPYESLKNDVDWSDGNDNNKYFNGGNQQYNGQKVVRRDFDESQLVAN